MTFGLMLRRMDRALNRAVGGVRTSILPGLVSGLRGWATPTNGTEPAMSDPGHGPPMAFGTEPEIVDLAPGVAPGEICPSSG